MLKTRFPHIFGIDVEYCGYKSISASYLMRSPEGKIALIDCGTPARYQIIKNSLKSIGARDEDVQSLILTHSHLDHSGSTSLLIQDFPKIKVFAHNKTLNVLRDPSAIIKHMSRVLRRYDEEFGKHIVPIPEKFLNELKDGQEIDFNGFRKLSILHTPGHTPDHITILSNQDELVFTGDAFGTLYDQIDKPITSCPIIFDPDDTIHSIKKIMNSGAKFAALSHYNIIDNIKVFGDKCIEFTEMIKRIAVECDNPIKCLEDEYERIFGPNFKSKRIVHGHFMTNCLGVKQLKERIRKNKQ